MTGSRRPWLVPVFIAVMAVAFLIAGVVTWRMSSAGVGCPPHVPCFLHGTGRHRHHPLRAELLFAGSALLAIIAAEVALWQRRQTSFRRDDLAASRYRNN